LEGGAVSADDQGWRPWWKQILLAFATLGLPLPAAREMRRQLDNSPESYREPLDRTGKLAMWGFTIAFCVCVAGVVVFVLLHL
jgi:hypothetical protein